MQDGYHVILTNRFEDLPAWFAVHPTEATGRCIGPMLSKLNAGSNVGERVDGPNVWRVVAGDRLVWIGAERPGLPSVEGVLCLLNFRESALVAGDGADTLESFVAYGAPTAERMPEADARALRHAVACVTRLGPPREFASEWLLG